MRLHCTTEVRSASIILDRPDYEGSTHLLNVGLLPRDYTALQRCALPPSWWWSQYAPLKRRFTSIRLHGARGALCLHHLGSPLWWRQYVPLKRRYTSTRLRGATESCHVHTAVKTWNITRYIGLNSCSNWGTLWARQWTFGFHNRRGRLTKWVTMSGTGPRTHLVCS
jgi:hypothetical protein